MHGYTCLQAVQISDSETLKALRELLERSKRTIQTELAFVVTILQPLYSAITALQKESAGILDIMHTFNGCDTMTGMCTTNDHCCILPGSREAQQNT